LRIAARAIVVEIAPLFVMMIALPAVLALLKDITPPLPVFVKVGANAELLRR